MSQTLPHKASLAMVVPLQTKKRLTHNNPTLHAYLMLMERPLEAEIRLHTVCLYKTSITD